MGQLHPVQKAREAYHKAIRQLVFQGADYTLEYINRNSVSYEERNIIYSHIARMIRLQAFQANTTKDYREAEKLVELRREWKPVLKKLCENPSRCNCWERI